VDALIIKMNKFGQVVVSARRPGKPECFQFVLADDEATWFLDSLDLTNYPTPGAPSDLHTWPLIIGGVILDQQ